MILGTSTGIIFVFSAKDFSLKLSHKVSDEEIIDIQNTRKGDLYKIYIKDRRYLYCLTMKLEQKTVMKSSLDN